MENVDDYLTNGENSRWHESNELFLKNLGDEAQLQAICHMYSHEEFSLRSRKFQLPIIILSVISGSGNFVSSNYPDYQAFIILGIGVLSIFTSIISSIAQYLKLAEKSEAHRIAFVSWEKFYNSIRFQLSKRRADRVEISGYISNTTGEFQRLQEISPLLPDHIVKKTIASGKGKKKIKEMSIPVSLRTFNPTTWWKPHDKLDLEGKKQVHFKEPEKTFWGGIKKNKKSTSTITSRYKSDSDSDDGENIKYNINESKL